MRCNLVDHVINADSKEASWNTLLNKIKKFDRKELINELALKELME